VRSFTTADLPGRCKRCWIVQAWCVCPDLPSVRPRTHVVVVRHLRESWKSTGTARVASLGIPSLTCLDYGEDAQPAAAALGELATEGTYVLLPGEQPAAWRPEQVKRLVVIDGTWRQARRMYQRLPALHGLPRITLTSPPRDALRLRDTAFAEGRSTLEAIAEALELIEGPPVSDPLFALHDRFVEQVLRARGVWERRLQERARP
jgi:DTW domain-containing protein YfiP